VLRKGVCERGREEESRSALPCAEGGRAGGWAVASGISSAMTPTLPSHAAHSGSFVNGWHHPCHASPGPLKLTPHLSPISTSQHLAYTRHLAALHPDCPRIVAMQVQRSFGGFSGSGSGPGGRVMVGDVVELKG